MLGKHSNTDCPHVPLQGSVLKPFLVTLPFKMSISAQSPITHPSHQNTDTNKFEKVK